MTTYERPDLPVRFELELRDFLEGESQLGHPDYLSDVLLESAGLRQRAAWTFPPAEQSRDDSRHVHVTHLSSLPKRARHAIEAEGRALLQFLSEDPDAADVRLTAVD